MTVSDNDATDLVTVSDNDATDLVTTATMILLT